MESSVNDTALNLKNILLKLLVLQLSIVPTMQTYAAHGNSPHVNDETSSTLESDPFRMPNYTDAKEHEHDLCDKKQSINGRCASCYCMTLGILSHGFGFQQSSGLVVSTKNPYFILYHIYLIPPFRPPIT